MDLQPSGALNYVLLPGHQNGERDPEADRPQVGTGNQPEVFGTASHNVDIVPADGVIFGARGLNVLNTAMKLQSSGAKPDDGSATVSSRSMRIPSCRRAFSSQTSGAIGAIA